MACERFRDALADVAAGEPSAAAVEAHLASCEACRAELEALRRALAVADAEMAVLVLAEPPPELASRIRQAVAAPETSGSAVEVWPPPTWRFGWLWPAVAAAATLLVALAVGLGRGSGPTPEPRVAVDRARLQPTGIAPVAEPLGKPVIPRASGLTDPERSATPGARGTGRPADPSSPRPTRPPRLDRAAVPPEPEVLVPTGEAEALLRFAAHLRTRVVSPDSMLVADLSAPLPEPKGVEIQPLAIVPLDPAETSGTD
jgi:hypothetical protein